MIDFDKEIEKFEESILVDDIEDDVYSYDKKDVVELLSEILDEMTR